MRMQIRCFVVVILSLIDFTIQYSSHVSRVPRGSLDISWRKRYWQTYRRQEILPVHMISTTSFVSGINSVKLSKSSALHLFRNFANNDSGGKLDVDVGIESPSINSRRITASIMIDDSVENVWKSNRKSMTNQRKSVNIRGKSSLEVCWALLGPLGVPYWRPWASWEHLGSVLRASWSVLGASRWHPGARRGPHMDPRMGPKSFKNRSKIALIFWSIFRCDFDPKMVTEWLPKPSKSGPKKCFIFRSFFSSIFG